MDQTHLTIMWSLYGPSPPDDHEALVLTKPTSRKRPCHTHSNNQWSNPPDDHELHAISINDQWPSPPDDHEVHVIHTAMTGGQAHLTIMRSMRYNGQAHLTIMRSTRYNGQAHLTIMRSMSYTQQ